MGEAVVVAWQSLTKLLQEVVDQALEHERVGDADKRQLFEMAVEFVADYKTRLFGITDDYLNISVYEYAPERNLLVCIACYRSRPSEAIGSHRSWRPGTGHVGKAFEMGEELICSDARHPDVAAWIAAPPENFREGDSEQYVSLAAIPIALRAQEPLGVLIMTSDQAGRFKSGFEEDEDFFTPSRVAVGALMDVAAQLAQLLYVVQSKGSTVEDGR